MLRSRVFRLTVGICLLASIGLADDQAEAVKAVKNPQPPAQIVEKIVDVKYFEQESDPPNLVVTVTGEVPTAGYQHPTLRRATYVAPPADGVQEYFLEATPPAGNAPQVISRVKATNTWKGVGINTSWLKGIRVYGAGDGVVVKMFSGADPCAHERQFEGQSMNGQLQEALDDALKQLDLALGEGDVGDAQAKWTITGVTGLRGGLAPANQVHVTITATRTPEWK
jgi:hypothetical protein